MERRAVIGRLKADNERNLPQEDTGQRPKSVKDLWTEQWRLQVNKRKKRLNYNLPEFL